MSAMAVNGRNKEFSGLTLRCTYCLPLALLFSKEKRKPVYRSPCRLIHESIDRLRYHIKSLMNPISSRVKCEAIAGAVFLMIVAVSTLSSRSCILEPGS